MTTDYERGFADCREMAAKRAQDGHGGKLECIAIARDIAALTPTPTEKASRHEETFETQLRVLLNTWSMENTSDTPDFVLCKFMHDCLEAFAGAVRKRDHWYGFKPFDANAATNIPHAPPTEKATACATCGRRPDLAALVSCPDCRGGSGRAP